MTCKVAGRGSGQHGHEVIKTPAVLLFPLLCLPPLLLPGCANRAFMPSETRPRYLHGKSSSQLGPHTAFFITNVLHHQAQKPTPPSNTRPRHTTHCCRGGNEVQSTCQVGEERQSTCPPIQNWLAFATRASPPEASQNPPRPCIPGTLPSDGLGWIASTYGCVGSEITHQEEGFYGKPASRDETFLAEKAGQNHPPWTLSGPSREGNGAEGAQHVQGWNTPRKREQRDGAHEPTLPYAKSLLPSTPRATLPVKRRVASSYPSNASASHHIALGESSLRFGPRADQRPKGQIP